MGEYVVIKGTEVDNFISSIVESDTKLSYAMTLGDFLEYMSEEKGDVCFECFAHIER